MFLERQPAAWRWVLNAIEVVHADTEQPDRPTAGFRTLEQLYRPRRNKGSIPCWRRTLTSCDGRKVAVAHLQRRGSRKQRLAFQPQSRVPRHLRDRLADGAQIG